ncbi:Succinate dehydrogenase, hydrophobic membrane anchor [mine drainage metagenome]|uniref:Succinate dehydrogenase, hydrophobic membrane anchor n=1 Tax=mine drainage metagenome TaxID=410659 RepID=T0YNV7_9ZZZZ
MNNLRTSYKTVTGLGSAHRGTGAWLAQRLTALALIPLLAWFVSALFLHLFAGRVAMLIWLRDPVTAFFVALALGIAFYHGYLGVRVVVEDYIHHGAAKWAVLVLLQWLVMVLGLADIYVLIRLTLRTP